MKTILSILTLIILTNCSTYSVNVGKKCTKLANDNTYEKSLNAIKLLTQINVKAEVKV